MSQDNRNNPVPPAHRGLRLVKAPAVPEPTKSPRPSAADNPLAKQLRALADAIDTDIAMILKF